MYIFELIAQAFKAKKAARSIYNPLEKSSENIEENPEDCEHLFLPLDSSNIMFACKYCGIIVPREKLKDRNIFRQ